MKTELITLAIIGAVIVSVVGILVSYNLYTNAQNRELYKQCMELTERLIKENNKSSTPYCRM